MPTLRMLLLLSLFGGAFATGLVWSHEHPHGFLSWWTFVDMAAIGLMVKGVLFVNRRLNAERPAARTAPILAERARLP
ncbi:hypothetical protein [Parasphingorhabdus pacifica]